MRFNVSTLKKVIRENRKKHVAVVADATSKYQTKLGKVLTQMQKELEKGKTPNFKPLWNLEAVENHTEDYDLILDMLEDTDDNFVELTQQEYKQYVKDQWNWRAGFKAANSVYSRLADDY